MKAILLLLTFFSVSSIAFAQTGTLSGKVKDKISNEPIIGATVAVTGTTQGATTDFEGNFSISLASGTYKIATTYVSYKPQVFENVQISAGQTTSLNISLEESATALEAVTITGARQTNTEVSLIKEIKNSNVVVSGMSAEQIMRTQDRDAAEVVKRIPGVTIQDNRFIMVRGLSERYNSVLLNESSTPSSEVDVKAFSFDILPASVIDRVMIYKSPAPELPGEFAGGVVKVYTKNVVNQNATTFGFSSSYRGGTTFKDFNTYKGGKTDLLAFDDGTRQLPGNFPANLDRVSNREKAQYGQLLPNTWQPITKTATPDIRFNLGLNRQFSLAGKDLTSITALSYTSARQNLIIKRRNYNAFDEALQKSDLNWSFQDQQSSQNTRLGVLQNFALRLNDNHKIEFRNLFNQIGIDQATVRTGNNFEIPGTEEQDYYLRYENRSIYSGQLQGTHNLANKHNVITWTGGYNFINRQEPDLRRARTIRQVGSEQSYKVAIPQIGLTTPLDAGRFYSDLTEKSFVGAAEFEHTFSQQDSLPSDTDSKIKIGIYTERKDRDFAARYLTYVRTSTTDQGLLNLPLDQIFAQPNLDATDGFLVDEGTDPSDRYNASNTLAAGYISVTKNIGNKIVLYGGARAEYNHRELNSYFNRAPVIVDDPTFYVLPSINTAYNFTNRSLVRLAYGMTLNRPEFREQAKFSFYDFNENASIQGNEELKTATIHNLDLRYEFYPNPTELLSLGLFYKWFINPIESHIIPGTGGQPIFSYINGDFSNSIGIETEIRKSFQELSQNKFIQNHAFVMNASLIHSRVDLGSKAVAQDRVRPMMGQSPYIVNTGVYYQDDEKGWQYTLMYNVLGKRIYRVGNSDNQTIYEMPRHVLDLTVTKNFKNGFQVKAGVQDLLNQATRFVQDSDENTKITGLDESIIEYKRGTYSTIGINYNF